VKTVLKEKGYGFIVLDDKELFFHVSIPGGDSVQGNDIVEVEVPKTTDGSGRMRAKQVRLLRRGSIFRQMCKNKCCLANGERHWEDHCPRGGSTTSVAVAPKTTAAAAPAKTAKMVTTAAASLKSVSTRTTKAPAVRLQNRYQMFDDDDDDDSVSTDCS
jgi:cold shock CspA family protein